MARKGPERPERRAAARASVPAAPQAQSAVAAPVHPLARWGLPLLIVAAVFAAFWPCLSQGFVAWDDDRNFLDNERWKGFSAENLSWMWNQSHIGHWHPLTWLSLALDYQLAGGVSPERIHLTNVILHAAGALLFYLLAIRLLTLADPRAGAHALGLRIAAAAGTLFYAIHPLRVESVAWATERRDVLSGLLLLACVLAWLRRATGGGALWLVAALAAYAASLLSKAWGITLPAVLLALDYWPLRRPAREGARFGRLALEKWPFVLIAVAGAWRAAVAQSEMSAVVGFGEHGLWQRIAQACYGLVFYVEKTIWPSGLSPLYELEREFDPTRPVYLASTAIVVAVAVAAFALRRRFPGWVCALFCYAAIASPVLGFLQSGAQKVADRYTYLACMPFAVIFAAGVLLAVRPAAATRALGALLLLTLPVLGFLCNRQTRAWSDSETLWRRVIEVEPASYIGHYNLAVTILRSADAAANPAERKSRVDEAIAQAQESIRLHPLPGNEDARYLLGLLRQRIGDADGAVAAWNEAIDVVPDHRPSLEALRGEYARRRDPAAAEALFRRAIERMPRNLAARDLLAQHLLGLQRTDEARGVFLESLQIDPRWVPALVGLASLEFVQGRASQAEPLLRAAIAVQPYDAGVWTALGEVQLALQKREEAIRSLQQALALAPGHAKARALLERAGGGG